MSPLFEALKTVNWSMTGIEFVIGICVGSFLNVLAIRSLAEESIFAPRSHCPKCKHTLGLLELIPIMSWFFLQGRCKHCQERIAWHYPFVEFFTGLTSIAIGLNFGWNWAVLPTDHLYGTTLLNCTGWAMAYFACMLITICITDFKEKLIPHDITYPSMIVGIIYSANNPNVGALNALAGAGISYILFDFLAFYGLKVYEHTHKSDLEEEEEEEESERNEKSDKREEQETESKQLLLPLAIEKSEADSTASPIHSENDSITSDEIPEDFEVMGGGDAVLSAVIAVWLGLKALGFVLLTGFLIGTVMGAVYLVIEMVKHKALHKAFGTMALAAGGLLILAEGFLYFLYNLQYPIDPNHPIASVFFQRMPWWQLGTGAIIAGLVLGTVIKGTRYSKPFPFGPALAVAAFVAIFFNPFDIQDAPGNLMTHIRNESGLRY